MILDSIEEQICTAIKPFAKSALDSNYSERQWTLGMKEINGDIGRSNEYFVCASGFPDKFSPEWLFDITWYKNISGEGSNLREVILALESEWNHKYDEIRYDFEKLLVARSKYKVLILQGRNANIPTFIEDLKKGVSDFVGTIKNDRYLFVAYNLDNHEFEFYHKIA